MRFLQDRLLLLQALRPAGAATILGLGLVLVLSACVPAGMAVALGAIVESLGRLTGAAVFAATVAPLAALGAVIFIGHLADAAAKPLEFLARTRIDGTHRHRILLLTTGTASIAPLETPEVQRLVRQTGAEPDYGVATPADGALAQLRWFAGLSGAAAVSVVLARYAWWLIPLLLIPAMLGLYLRSRQYFAAVASLRSAMKEELHADVWRNAASSSAEGKDVRIFGFAGWMVNRMQDHIQVGNAPFWQHVTRVAQRSWLQFSLALAGLVPAYVLVTMDAVRGATTVGVQTAVFLAGWSIFGAVGSSEGVYHMAGSAAVVRAFVDLRSHLEQAGCPAAAAAVGLPPPPPDGAPPLVRFEDVRFSYPGMDRLVLAGIDLEIRPGELLAIVGLNGAGKSTLIKLLAGLYEPSCGRITADGTPITPARWEAWRERISVVFQDFVRYEMSVADNVALGQASTPTSLSRTEAAAAEAGLSALVSQLPHGWDTPLSRNRVDGVDLSGGQWQQVVLARALYALKAGARLLVLDEPTAHLDVRTEFAVFRRLAEHRADTSVVLISHRLSTVRLADRIVLLEDGKITETGSHDELMALGGTYARLFTLQSKRFWPEGQSAADETESVP